MDSTVKQENRNRVRIDNVICVWNIQAEDDRTLSTYIIPSGFH